KRGARRQAMDRVSRSSASARNSLAILLAFAVLMGGGTAFAKRVVVLKFSGPQAKKAEKIVASIVKREHTVVSYAKFKKTQTRLHAKKLNPRNIQRLSEE